MGFALFLNEGLIKLPERLRKELYTFFLDNYFSYLYDAADFDNRDDIDKKLLDSVFKKMCTKYGVKNPDPKLGKKLALQKTVSKKFKNEIPKEYISALMRKDKEFYDRNKTTPTILKGDMKFTISFKDGKRVANTRGVYWVGANEIILSISNLFLNPHESAIIEYMLAMKMTELYQKLDKALSTIDHELTHAVQFLVLQDLHGDQLNGSDKEHKKANSNYYSSQLEFDPWIKNSITYVKQLSGFNKASPTEKRKMLEKFTCSDVPTSQLEDLPFTDDRSTFFIQLKLHNVEKWRKAVKLLFTEVFK